MYEEVIIMKLVAAKCPSCGAGIKVDRSLINYFFDTIKKTFRATFVLDAKYR